MKRTDTRIALTVFIALGLTTACLQAPSQPAPPPPDGSGTAPTLRVQTPIMVWNGPGTSVQIISNSAGTWSSPPAALNPLGKASATISGSGSSVTATLPAPGVYRVQQTTGTQRTETWIQAWDRNGALSTPLGTRPAVSPPRSVRGLTRVPAALTHPRLFFNASDWPEVRDRAARGRIAGWGVELLRRQVASSIDAPGSAIGWLGVYFDRGTGTQPDLTPLTKDSVLASEASDTYWGMLLGASALFWLEHDPIMDVSAFSTADRERAQALARMLAGAATLYLRENWTPQGGFNASSRLPIAGLQNLGEQVNCPGISEIAVAYDLLYPWMSDLQRTAVRDLLYAVGWGRHQAPAGFDSIGKVRSGYAQNGDFSNLNDHALLAGMAIEGEEDTVTPAVRSAFGTPVGTATRWMKALGAGDVNAWPGATQAQLDGLERALRWMVDWQTTPWGMVTSHLAYFAFSAKHMFPSLLAYARRTENAFVTTNLYQISLHALQALHPAEGQSSRNTFANSSLGWWDHHDSGSYGQRGTAPILLKYMYPDDPLVDYVYRAYLPGLDRDPLVAALFGLDPGSGVAEQTLSQVAAAKELPNVIFDPQQGFVTLRSGWSDEDISLWFDNNSSNPRPGHMHAERNSFDLFALGRAWSIAPGYHVTISDAQAAVLVRDPRYSDDRATGGFIGQSPSSATQRPGFPGHFPPLPGKLLEVTSDPAGAWSLVAGDATTAYSYGNEQGSSGSDTGLRFEDFLYPGMLEVFKNRDAGFARFYSRTLSATSYNPMRYALRTMLLVRGARPYVIVVDDIDKDGAVKDWQWTMNSAQGFGGDKRFVDASGNGVYSSTAIMPGASSSQAVLYHSPIDDASGPRLLVRDLGPNAVANQPAIRLESKRPNAVGVDYLTFGVDNNHPEAGAVKVPTNRLLIERRAVSRPEFTVLLFPYRQGEALPVTTWNADRSVLSVDLGGGVTHRIAFDRSRSDHRTRITVSTR